MTSSLTLEIIIGLATVVAGTLVADKYESYRNRPIIEISAAFSGDRLGFSLKVKRKSLNHPHVLFYGGYTRTNWGYLHPCDLYDEDGNIYKDDLIIAGGKPVCIYPLLVKRELQDEEGNMMSATVHVLDPQGEPAYRDILTQKLPSIPKEGDYAFVYPKEPYSDQSRLCDDSDLCRRS